MLDDWPCIHFVPLQTNNRHLKNRRHPSSVGKSSFLCMDLHVVGIYFPHNFLPDHYKDNVYPRKPNTINKLIDLAINLNKYNCLSTLTTLICMAKKSAQYE